VHTKFWSENLKERSHSEDVGVDEGVIGPIKIDIRITECECVIMIQLAQDTAQ